MRAEVDSQQVGTKAKKRRPTPSSSYDESGDDSKRRGRPRVEKQDESAADRRRTQIRKAQRAYRQRKESTLEELRNRVSELCNVIELMDKTFVEFRERTVASGLSAAQKDDLQSVISKYESLVKRARNPGEVAIPGVEYHAHRQNPGSGIVEESTKTSADMLQDVSSWMDEKALVSLPRQSMLPELGMGYSLTGVGLDDLDSNLTYFGPAEPPRMSAGPNVFLASHLSTTESDRIEEIFMCNSLSPPASFSFQEATFGRRLHRAALEKGYQLLLDPNPSPEVYNRVFRLSLLYRDRTKLLKGISQVLARGSIDQTSIGSIHIGGAGTHYSRADPFGNILPKKQTWNLGVVAPQSLALLDQATKTDSTTAMTVDVTGLSGFEGEWFDAYDVEGYLRDRGIVIDPFSSLNTAEIPIPMHGVDPSMRPLSRAEIEALSRNSVRPDEWSNFSSTSLTDIGYSPPQTETTPNLFEPKLTARQDDAMDVWDGSGLADFLMKMGDSDGKDFEAINCSTRPPQQQPQQQKKLIFVDVPRFVAVMTAAGVCDGNGPAFRRRDVDRALALSAFDAVM